MKIKIYKVILLALFLSACLDQGLPSGARTGGFKVSDPAKHKTILDLMKQKKIPYEINDHGRVVYLVKDMSKVLGIKRKVQHGNSLDKTFFEVAVLVDKLTRDKYEAAFKKAGIPYKIFDHKGVTQISWSQIYGPKVDIIRQKVAEEIMGIVIENQ